MDFCIRRAQPSDAAALSHIYAYYVENTAVSYECTAPDETEFSRRIEETLKKYPYIVAENSEGILGYAYAGAFNTRAAAEHTAEASIYIDARLRRCGVGRALYEKLEEILKAQNFQMLTAKLACCSRSDDPYLTRDSLIFHEKCGYQAVGAVENCGYKFSRWYDLMILQKHIGSFPQALPDIIPFSKLSY